MARVKAKQIDRGAEFARQYYATFGAAMRGLRKLDGLSLVRFAERLGISVTHMQDVEKDRRPVSVRRAVEWARILDVPLPPLLRLVLQRKVDEAGAPVRVVVELYDAA